jgi:hypothetical protein
MRLATQAKANTIKPLTIKPGGQVHKKKTVRQEPVTIKQEEVSNYVQNEIIRGIEEDQTLRKAAEDLISSTRRLVEMEQNASNSKKISKKRKSVRFQPYITIRTKNGNQSAPLKDTTPKTRLSSPEPFSIQNNIRIQEERLHVRKSFMKFLDLAKKYVLQNPKICTSLGVSLGVFIMGRCLSSSSYSLLINQFFAAFKFVASQDLCSILAPVLAAVSRNPLLKKHMPRYLIILFCKTLMQVWHDRNLANVMYRQTKLDPEGIFLMHGSKINSKEDTKKLLQNLNQGLDYVTKKFSGK